MTLTGIFLVCYLLGHLSFGHFMQKLFRLPRLHTVGSRNVGATNMWRIGGAWPAILTFVGDTAKGTAAMFIAHACEPSTLSLTVASLGVLLGHIYPLGFAGKGGKGVATAFGIVLAFSWKIGLLLLLCWVAIWRITRTSSIASLSVALLMPALMWCLHDQTLAWRFSVLTGILLLTHVKNIYRIVKKKELRT